MGWRKYDDTDDDQAAFNRKIDDPRQMSMADDDMDSGDDSPCGRMQALGVSADLAKALKKKLDPGELRELADVFDSVAGSDESGEPDMDQASERAASRRYCDSKADTIGKFSETPARVTRAAARARATAADTAAVVKFCERHAKDLKATGATPTKLLQGFGAWRRRNPDGTVEEFLR